MNIISTLRGLLFSLGMIISIFTHATLTILLTSLLPFKYRYWFITRWSRFIIWWLKITCDINYHIEGLDNLPKQAAIIISNHQSTWETLAFHKIFPRQCNVLKKELLEVPLFGWALRLLSPIAINREDRHIAMEQLISQGSEKLRLRTWVTIFPQGSRMKPGEKIRFARGGAALSKAANAPIVPVAHNAGVYWPRKGFIKNPGTIRVVIGPAIYPEGLTTKQLNDKVQQWIDNTARTLS